MWFGIALVLVGIALIVLLVRRNRADKVDGPGAAHPEVPLPRNPGGTTYRSAAPAGGQVYGQQPPAAPGGYGATPAAPAAPGGYGAAPAARPTGNVYGSQPAGEPPAPDATAVMPRLPD